MRLQEVGALLFKVRATSALEEKGPDRSRLMLRARQAIGIGLLVLLTCSTLPQIRRALSGPFPDEADAFHSSNAYLRALIGSPNASERIIDIMRSLPSDKPLLIFERDKDPSSSLLGMELAYLAWPREVRFEIVPAARCGEQLAKVSPSSVSAVAFCDLPSPAWITGGIRLGPSGKLIAFAHAGDAR